MSKANEKLRTMLTENHIPYWKVALAVGVHENTIIRWMRTELDAETERRIEDAVTQLLRESD